MKLNQSKKSLNPVESKRKNQDQIGSDTILEELKFNGEQKQSSSEEDERENLKIIIVSVNCK